MCQHYLAIRAPNKNYCPRASKTLRCDSYKDASHRDESESCAYPDASLGIAPLIIHHCTYIFYYCSYCVHIIYVLCIYKSNHRLPQVLSIYIKYLYRCIYIYYYPCICKRWSVMDPENFGKERHIIYIFVKKSFINIKY